MAMGMEMMLKSFGLDPAEIKRGAEDIKAMVADIHAKFVSIDERLARIEAAVSDMEPKTTSYDGPSLSNDDGVY